MANVRAAHMCRDGHVEIYHNDSEHEMCPLCRCKAALREALEGWQLYMENGMPVPIEKEDEHDARIAALRKEFLDV